MMVNLTRLTDRIINLSFVREIRFQGDTLEIHFSSGDIITLEGKDAALLLWELEKNYNLMTATGAVLWRECDLGLCPSESTPVSTWGFEDQNKNSMEG